MNILTKTAWWEWRGILISILTWLSLIRYFLPREEQQGKKDPEADLFRLQVRLEEYPMFVIKNIKDGGFLAGYRTEAYYGAGVPHSQALYTTPITHPDEGVAFSTSQGAHEYFKRAGCTTDVFKIQAYQPAPHSILESTLDQALEEVAERNGEKIRQKAMEARAGDILRDTAQKLFYNFAEDGEPEGE